MLDEDVICKPTPPCHWPATVIVTRRNSIQEFSSAAPQPQHPLFVAHPQPTTAASAVRPWPGLPIRKRESEQVFVCLFPPASASTAYCKYRGT